MNKYLLARFLLRLTKFLTGAQWVECQWPYDGMMAHGMTVGEKQ